MTRTRLKLTVEKVLPWILVVAGIVGVLMSAIIMMEKIKLLQNPAYIPSCNLDPIVSCGPVMASKQALAFGFPNPIMGLIAFPVLIATGVAILAGATFKKWYWVGLEIGTIFGIGFVHWLFFESTFRIHALCPYCIVVWIMTIGVFIYVTAYNLRNGIIILPRFLKPLGKLISNHHLDIYVLWLLVIAGIILHHFWYFYGPKFGF